MKRKRPTNPYIREMLDREASDLADYYETELSDSEMDDIFRCEHGTVGWCSECVEEKRRDVFEEKK